MRKLMQVLGVLMVLSMVLTACAAPTAVATQPPAVVEQPTEAAPVEAPTEAAPAEEVVLNPYLGSNKLDGNGVPADFFADVHIRRAFAYCFDWDTVINDVYKGEAVQSKVLSLPGMPGFDPEAPFYSMDLDKCAE